MKNQPHFILALLAVLATTCVFADVPSVQPKEAAETAPSSAPSNQIWECTTKGVRTFSSNPCGTKSTVRELSPINVMEPQPTYHASRTYPPQAAPAASNAYPAQDTPDQTSTDNAYNAYPVVVVPRAHRFHPNTARNHPHPTAHHQ